MVALPTYTYAVFVISAEIIYFFLAGLCYTLFSFFAFGEGANSFMYTNANTFIYIGIKVVMPSIVNIINIFKYWNNCKNKVTIHLVAQAIIIALLIGEIIYLY